MWMAHTHIHPLSFHTHLLSACCHTVRHGASGRSWGAHQLFWTSDNHVSICDLLLLGDCHAFRLSPALGLTLPRTMGALGHMTTPSKGVYSRQSSSVQPSFPFERLYKAGSTRLGHIRALVRRSCSLTSPRTRTPIHKPSGHCCLAEYGMVTYCQKSGYHSTGSLGGQGSWPHLSQARERSSHAPA